MAQYRFSRHVAAPPEQVFALWTDLDRAHEWIAGLTRVTDVSGPIDRVGTRYTAWFGSMKSPSEVVAVERPRLFTSRFGSRLLRGLNSATFEAEADGTRLTQLFTVEGLLPRLAARIFATGSYRGSFRGELTEFARIAESEAGGTQGAR
jgi:uncharacterized protein YndB with AHSA1/START domain